MSTQPYSDIREPDCAGLTAVGIYYLTMCYIDNRTGSLVARMYVEQPHGQRILVNTWIVFDASPGDLVAPRMVAADDIFTIFVGDTNTTVIRKFWLEMSSGLPGNVWGTAGTTATHADMLFDAHTLASGDDLVLAHKSALGSVTVVRHDNPASSTATWTTTLAVTPINCLGVWADATTNKVYTVFQRSGLTQLWHGHGDAAGSAPVAVQTFTAATINDVNWSAAAITPMGGPNLAVVAEGRDDSVSTTGGPSGALFQTQSRLIAYRRIITSSGLRGGNEHWTHNCNLQSKPWSYAGAATDGSNPRTYVCVGFKGQPDKNDWAQIYYYVVDLNSADWGSFGDGFIRATPVANMNLGSADSRNHEIIESGVGPDQVELQFKHWNHLSNAALPPQFGPNLKTRTFMVQTWGRLTSINPGVSLADIELEPMTAKISGYIFQMEEPWMTNRDPTDPAMPTTNWRFAFPWRQNAWTNYGTGTVLAGGTPKLYDGDQAVEVGFCWIPEILFKSQNTGAAPFEAGTYFYTVVAEWRDNQGKLHRSSPITPVEEILSGTALSINITIRCINLSMKEAYDQVEHPTIDLVPYRTTVGGSTFYRIFGGTTTGATNQDTPSNDPDVPWIVVVDPTSDTEIRANDVLPWQFINAQWAPLTPIQPPASPVTEVWRNRLWLGGGEEPGVLWYSLQSLPEPGGTTIAAPEFNPVNTYRINSGDEQVIALQPMDHMLLVFTEDTVYALNGEPGDDAGFGTTLDVQKLTEGIGCIDQNSVVLTPNGVFFQSMKGIYMMTRQMQVEYIGADVEDIIRSAGNVRAVTLMEDRNEVRYILNESPEDDWRVLAFNYLFRQWSRFKFVDGLTATANLNTYTDGLDWRGRNGEIIHVVLAGGGVLLERADDANAYKDADTGGTSPVVMDAQTGWLRPGPDINLYYRMRGALLQLDKPEASKVSITVDYEVEGKFDNSLSETFSIDPSPQGVRVQFGVQKCSAVRLRIFEANDVEQTENIKINAVALVLGQKRGTKRVPDANIAT